MSEENKEKPDFLSSHQDLLNSLNKKKEAEANAETTEKTDPPKEESVIAEKPQPEPVIEEQSEPEKEDTVIAEPVVEKEPVIEEVVAEEEILAEAVIAEEEPVIEAEVEEEEEPVVDQEIIADIPPVVKETPAKPPVKKKKPANHTEAVKQRHDRIEQAEVKDVLHFIQKYVKPAAIGILAICIIFLGNSLIKNGKMKKEAKADSALMVAQTAADFQAILDNYGNTSSAPLALLGLAQENFNATHVAEAEKLYGQFLNKYPKHEMAVQVELNQIQCLEAMQEYAKAAAAYAQFKTDHPNSHLAPVALLGQARCLEATQSYSEAVVVYDDICAFYPNSGWAQLAEANLAVVKSKIK
ncbi:tetratricopeptide repeat protein [Pontiellaceae bacterium B12219]|nr:tetratricopeptide repeat protein [Pontiellaceae bacterium B12219]